MNQETRFKEYLPYSPNWSTELNGRYLIAKITECHKTEKESLLQDILEEKVDRKYFVSKKIMKNLVNKNFKNDFQIIDRLGNIQNRKISGALSVGGHGSGNHSDMDLIVTPVLSPDRINKKQNGRRFKDPGDNSYTLTAQDRHAVMIERKLTELTSNMPDAKRVYDTGMARTLKALGGGLGAKTGLYQTTESQIRRLTPTECERLQGFPDFWTEGLSDSQRYKTLGNAVTTNVVTVLINEMFKNTKYERIFFMDQQEKWTWVKGTLREQNRLISLIMNHLNVIDPEDEAPYMEEEEKNQKKKEENLNW